MSARLVSCIVFVVAGCATEISYSPLNRSPRPMVARAPESVELFVERVPARRFVEVALIRGVEGSDQAQIVPAMRRRAAAAGCDAMIVRGGDNRLVASNGTAYEQKGYQGTCIVFE